MGDVTMTPQREALIRETWKRQRGRAANDLKLHGAFRCVAMAFSHPVWEQLQKDKIEGTLEHFLFTMETRLPLMSNALGIYRIECEGIEVETGPLTSQRGDA